MTPDERNELIDWLVIWIGWARQAFEKMSDEELRGMEQRYGR